MNGLLFLTSDDFEIARGTKGNILCNKIRGISLVLFSSTQCHHCRNLIPIFKKLPGNISGCQFGMINVSSNKKCVAMSQETITPIKYVPYIILYVDGRPLMKYDGPHESGEILRFVVEVTQKIQSKQKFSDSKKLKKDTKADTSIPGYTIGHPLCGPDDKVCYLEFDTAYNKNGR